MSDEAYRERWAAFGERNPESLLNQLRDAAESLTSDVERATGNGAEWRFALAVAGFVEVIALLKNAASPQDSKYRIEEVLRAMAAAHEAIGQAGTAITAIHAEAR